METKELEVNIPEGYEIDVKNYGKAMQVTSAEGFDTEPTI